MGLQFYFGGSGAGKSDKLHKDIIRWSVCEPQTQFLFVVPDQFTMHTQMELVKAHPNRGILNIDVLSFGRLSHRIFEEVGGDKRQVLDDTGKSLVLRKVAADIREELPVIGKNLTKLGYIHEVKSAVSEFMQYGIGPEELAQLTDFARKKGVLSSKLKDLQKLYEAFLTYIQGEFITTEETLDLLKNSLCKSEIIKDSVVIFDGFTGFTPIQNRVIQELMVLTERVIVSVTIGSDAEPFGTNKEHELFYLSKKTVADLCLLAKEAQVGREEDVYLREEPLIRFAGNGEMAHLEKNLFRYPEQVYEEENRAIALWEATTVAEEVRQVCVRVKELVLAEGFSYRDIAVVTGDLSTYAGYMEREAKKYEIPLFVDQTSGILLNPFTEFIRSALKIVIKNFSYEAVFHYLRSGFADFEPEEVDCLENYVIGFGIKGKRKWSNGFTRRSRQWEEESQLEQLAKLNSTRERMMQQLEPLTGKFANVEEIIHALYGFITGSKIQQKLAVYETYFKNNEDWVRAREYGQIYRLVMELLDQIYSLLSKEQMTLAEFADILDAGLGEIEVGTIPQNVDRVVVGDMERTRLNRIKVLFFLGVNDGNIPRNNGKGGIISDLDREFLKESKWELAPTPRQQMYIQRLYLYMNMTKPSERLYLSYAKVNCEGKSIRPSYLVDTIQKIFPQIKIKKEQNEKTFEQIVGLADSLDIFTVCLRDFASGIIGRTEDDQEKVAIFCDLYRQTEDYDRKAAGLIDTAFAEYAPHPLGKMVADALYGSLLENSVSRLEKYASCAYAHFLQYGLALQEREEYSFETVDLGNVFHGVLELFAGKLAENHFNWFDFPDEEAMGLLREALNTYAAEYGETVLFSSARNQQMVSRIYRILARTVKTLKQQLQKGAFVPQEFEVSFSKADNLAAVNIALSQQEKMRLRGRIDRIDTYEDEDHVYVKVIDYKSGNKKFDLAALYYGLQLQLVVYMNVAMEIEKRAHPDKEVVPAALLYYHVSDPMIKGEDNPSPEEINQRLQQELRTKGLVNADEGVISLLDRDFTGKSLVVPVERNKDGSLSKKASVINEKDYNVISNYVNHKIKSFGQEIKAGNITVNPYEGNGGQACTYCAYRSICGYDIKMPGYQTRRLDNLPAEAVMERMRRELDEAETGRMQ